MAQRQPSQKEKDLVKIIRHMTVRIPDRPATASKPQLSWMGLKPSDKLSNTVPLMIFEDRVYSTKLLSSLLQPGHVFTIAKVTADGAEINLDSTMIDLVLEDKDWKSKFKKVRRVAAKKTAKAKKASKK